MSKFRYHKKSWHVLEDKKVFGTPVFDLNRKRSASEPGETAGDFYVLQAPEWIIIIALTTDRKIIAVEQYRHGIDEVTLEVPGGMVDKGENPQESAERELAEETGYTSASWDYLGKVSSNPAIMNNYTHIYLASECRKTRDQHTGEFEDIYVQTMEIQEFLKYAKEGVIHHSIVLAAIAKYLLMTDDNI